MTWPMEVLTHDTTRKRDVKLSCDEMGKISRNKLLTGLLKRKE
jgi:hypothetical protein